MYKIFIISLLAILACTSKNRFDPNQQDSGANNASSRSENNNQVNNIKGTIEDVESDAKPYLKSVADTPRWSANFGRIQDEIFDVKLDLSFENKICFGIVKRMADANNPGEFFVGEVNTNNQKIQVQFYAEKKPCTDNHNNTHNGRITMLLNNKEYYSCADFLE